MVLSVFLTAKVDKGLVFGGQGIYVMSLSIMAYGVSISAQASPRLLCLANPKIVLLAASVAASTTVIMEEGMADGVNAKISILALAIRRPNETIFCQNYLGLCRNVS